MAPPETATNLNDLALLLKDQGDLTRARPLFERASAIRENLQTSLRVRKSGALVLRCARDKHVSAKKE